jgi:hypothetical protein
VLVIRTRLAGTRLLLVGLAVAAVVAGSAAAAMPVLRVSVHARLAPVAGTNEAGRFNGMLVKNIGVLPPSPSPQLRWHLSWKVRLPALRTPATASLQIPARNGAAGYSHVLCNGCRSTASGTLALTNNQAGRLIQSQATVVVLAPSQTLRGAVKAQAILPKPVG